MLFFELVFNIPYILLVLVVLTWRVHFATAGLCSLGSNGHHSDLVYINSFASHCH